ncbi:hypothetical protein ALC57_14049, partial [Trachymyrmex cornetzi]
EGRVVFREMLVEVVWREGKGNESMKEMKGRIREVLGNTEKERGKERKGMGWWGRECREKEEVRTVLRETMRSFTKFSHSGVRCERRKSAVRKVGSEQRDMIRKTERIIHRNPAGFREEGGEFLRLCECRRVVILRAFRSLPRMPLVDTLADVSDRWSFRQVRRCSEKKEGVEKERRRKYLDFFL